MKYDTLKAILKKNGSSLTLTRRFLFDLLDGQEPQSIQVLISRSEDHLDRATVYRTIKLFEKIGIAHRLNVGWKYKIELSDIFSEHHHHLYCSNCKKIIDLPANFMLETMINSLATKSGFAPRGHQLEIYGLCPACSWVDYPKNTKN